MIQNVLEWCIDHLQGLYYLLTNIYIYIYTFSHLKIVMYIRINNLKKFYSRITQI